MADRHLSTTATDHGAMGEHPDTMLTEMSMTMTRGPGGIGTCAVTFN